MAAECACFEQAEAMLRARLVQIRRRGLGKG